MPFADHYEVCFSSVVMSLKCDLTKTINPLWKTDWVSMDKDQIFSVYDVNLAQGRAVYALIKAFNSELGWKVGGSMQPVNWDTSAPFVHQIKVCICIHTSYPLK